MSLALRDRAYELVASQALVSDERLLAHVYGGSPPAALRERLLAPLLEDPRLERVPAGWRLRQVSSPSERPEVTVLALVPSGPDPRRARVVHLTALHVAGQHVAARFSLTFNPQTRVPRYVAERLGSDDETFEACPTFLSAFDDLQRFLIGRALLAQEAGLAWAFLDAEARRIGRVLAVPELLDLNAMVAATPALRGKPTLAAIARHFGLSPGRIEDPREEARVLALLVPLVLPAEGATEPGRASMLPPLRRGETARGLPDAPGVYVLRDGNAEPLYVGKARRLRSRLEAYVHRPLGPTRRLEGLTNAVQSVESAEQPTELEALVMEAREISRLQPRFNTVRRQQRPRLWIRLPPPPPPKRAPRRLMLVEEPRADGEHLGPFRNQAAAEQARGLARAVFDLDALRRDDPFRYEEHLRLAWAFVHGERDAAVARLRTRQAAAASQGDRQAVRACERLLAETLAYAPGDVLLAADPRSARYAVLRPATGTGIEGLVIESCVLTASATLADPLDAARFAADLLAMRRARTQPEDAPTVLRWLGAQRPSARLLPLPEQPLDAADAIEQAALSLLAAQVPGPPDVEDAGQVLGGASARLVESLLEDVGAVRAVEGSDIDLDVDGGALERGVGQQGTDHHVGDG
jgi:hypothetical protein